MQCDMVHQEADKGCIGSRHALRTTWLAEYRVTTPTFPTDIPDILALIHTFPFIIVDRKQGMMDMIMQSDWYTVSGIICLVPQTLLVSLSIAPIRNRAYELFKG